MEQLGDERGVIDFKGGETAALARLDYYINKNLLKTYKNTRNGMIGADYSSKFSPWLANGSISVKQIYHAVKLYESQNNLNKLQAESLNHFISELYWRDFFRFYCVNWENAIFYAEGIKNSAPKW